MKARLVKYIWRISGHRWDNDLPEEIKKQFLEWSSGLHLLGSLTIPRSYFTEPFDRIELHLFGDSSQDVFCAVAFLRARLARSNQIELTFVFGKACVAPIEFRHGGLSHRVILDRVHRLLVTLYYFRPDRFVQLLSLIPILILLL